MSVTSPPSSVMCLCLPYAGDLINNVCCKVCESFALKIKPVQKPLSVKCSFIMLDFMFEALLCFVLFLCPSYLVHANLCLQFHMVEKLRPLVSVWDFSFRITRGT